MLPIEFDCHIHTTRSACGEDITDDWLCQKARSDSLRFAVTDHTMHLYYEPEIAWAMYREDAIPLFEARRKQGRDTIARYVDDLRDCDSDNLLVGVELDVLPDGQIMFPDELRPELDLFLGAIHLLPTVQNKAEATAVENEYKQQTRWLMDYGIDVLAHPFRVILGSGYEVGEPLVEWTVDLAAEYGVALEVNSHKPYREHDLSMVRLCAERGVLLAVGTDAHHSREFGQFQYHRQLFRRAGLSESEAAKLLYTPDNGLPL